MTRSLLVLAAALGLLTPSLTAPAPAPGPQLAGSPSDPYVTRVNTTITTIRDQRMAEGNAPAAATVDNIRGLDRDKENTFKGVDFSVKASAKRSLGGNLTQAEVQRRSMLALGYGPSGTNGQVIPAAFLTAMQTFTKLAAAAYCTPDQITSWNCRTCPGGISNIKYFGGYWSGMQGYVATYDARQTIIVSFRGSANIENWIANLQFAKADADFLVSGAKVHTGFLDKWNEVKSTVVNLVQAARQKNPGYSVTFTGHSLGGATALIAAMDASYKWLSIPASDISVFSVGMPRVGNARFAQAVYDRGISIFRGTNYNDIVPHLPPSSFGFVHADYETWINGNGQVVYCDDGNRGGETTICANTIQWVWQMNAFTHLMYYGQPTWIAAC
ncbi:hypothetical protein HK104_002878 [Borealophlyctis nickersoniae]|nr:hypothetical protein HK104_002878 [Borealophlyctis nickersoniae]